MEDRKQTRQNDRLRVHRLRVQRLLAFQFYQRVKENLGSEFYLNVAQPFVFKETEGQLKGYAQDRSGQLHELKLFAYPPLRTVLCVGNYEVPLSKEVSMKIETLYMGAQAHHASVTLPSSLGEAP